MSFFKTISNTFSNFLDFVDRHQNGILMTVIVHLAIITALLIIKIRQSPSAPDTIEINFSQEDLTEEKPEELSEDDLRLMQAYEDALSEFRNMPVNRSSSEQVARENIDKMVSDIKQELNVNDADYVRDDTPTPEISPEDNISVADNIPQKKETNPEDNTLYQGPTTLSYDLEGRTHVHMTIPVYMCKGSGEVKVSIIVNLNGSISSVSVLSAHTSDGSDCFVEAALTAARSSRFNADPNAQDKQKGSITYIFLPQ